MEGDALDVIFCPRAFALLSMVAVERTPHLVEVTIVALEVPGIDSKLDWTGGGLDLKAVTVIPLLAVAAGDGVARGDFLAIIADEVIGSIIKLLLDPVEVTEEGVRTAFEAGITSNVEPALVATLMVGVDIVAPEEGGSGIKPLKLAKISATFLRSACVGLAVPLICPVTVELRACFTALPEATDVVVP